MSSKAATSKPRRRVGLRLRALMPQDLDAVVEIDGGLNGRKRRAYFERRLAAARREPDLHVQLAVERRGAFAGYVLGKILEGEFGRDPAIRLEVIGVAPEGQGKGVGQMLGEALETEARKRGIVEIRTGASWREHRLLAYLDHAGWSLSGAYVIDCAIADATLGSSHESPVVLAERERPADQHDYAGRAANDFETLARDTAEVRALSADDLDAVARIDRRRSGRDRTGYIRHKIGEALADSGVRVSLVACREDSIAGFVMASADYGDFGRAEPTAVIDTIGVDPGYARSGIGRALLSQLFINLRALHIERVETLVGKNNFDLLGFLFRAGFGPSERLSLAKRLG